MAPESFESRLERLIATDRMSRRGFVGRAGSTVLAGSALAAFLQACGGAEGTNESAGKTQAEANHAKTALGTIIFSNWPLYIDKKVIKDFNKETGAKLKYLEDINDNTEFFGKVRQQLQQGRPIDRDLVALTDWMAARWIRLGYTEPIDKKNVPNEKNLRADLRGVPWDDGRKNSLPWQSGMTGIGFNRKEVGDVKSVKQLFDPQYKGKVTVLSEARDTLGLIMGMQGADAAKATPDQIQAATDFLQEQQSAGQIRKFTGNDYAQDLAKGNVVMAFAWSGDMVQLRADNPDLDFVIPEEGGMLWSDNMMMPKKAASPYGAEVFMNHVYEPEVAAKIAAYVNYVTPVEGTKEILASTDPEIAENPLIFPDEATLGNLSVFPALSVEDEQRMNEGFETVAGA